MTVAVETPQVSYTGDGVTTSFPLPFTYANPSDVVATILGVASPSYSVSGANVVFTTAPAVGAKVHLARATPRAQLTAFPAGNPIPSESLAIALDRAMRVDQEQDAGLADLLARTFLVPSGERGLTLPSASERAGRFFAFDGAGNPVMVSAVSTSGGVQLSYRMSFTATEGQSIFNGIAPMTPGSVTVYLNGFCLPPSAYTVSGIAVTLTALTEGDEVEIAVTQDSVTALSPAGTINVADYLSSTILATDAAGLTANLAKLQQAVSDCVAANKALWIPPPPTGGAWRVNGTAAIPDGGISIVGGGEIRSVADAPIFRLAGGSFLKQYRDFSVVFESLVNPSFACALELAASVGTQFIQYNYFGHISCSGGFAVLVDRSATRTTAFGQESPVNWNVFDNLIPLSSRYGYYSAVGSGTGNTWINARSYLTGTAPAYLELDGAGCVVGDVWLIGGHLGAAPATVDAVAIAIGANTKYRSKIGVVGCQTDSNMARVFRFSNTNLATDPYTEIDHDGAGIGGGTILGIDVPVMSGNIVDRDGLDWKGGKQWAAAGTGAQTVAVCKVTLGQWTGARLVLKPSGLVNGVASGSAKIEIPLSSTASAVSAGTLVTSSNPAGLFAASVAVAGLVATISLTFTPTSPNSSGFVSWRVDEGSNLCVERL